MNEEVVIGLVVNSGNAKSLAIKALRAAKQNKMEEAEQFMKEAKDSLAVAHETQTELISQEASGTKHEISLIMVHAQDHLMNAITVIDLVTELIDTFKK